MILMCCLNVEVKQLREQLAEFSVNQYEPTFDIIKKYKDGGVSIIDQWICAHARYFACHCLPSLNNYKLWSIAWLYLPGGSIPLPKMLVLRLTSSWMNDHFAGKASASQSANWTFLLGAWVSQKAW